MTYLDHPKTYWDALDNKFLAENQATIERLCQLEPSYEPLLPSEEAMTDEEVEKLFGPFDCTYLEPAAYTPPPAPRSPQKPTTYDIDDDYDDTDVWCADHTHVRNLLGELDLNDPDIEDIEKEFAIQYLMDRTLEEDNYLVRQEAMWQLSEMLYKLNGGTAPTQCISPNNPWKRVKDGDKRLFAVFKDHYSYKPKTGRKNNLCIGPGFKLPLIIPNTIDPAHGRPQAIFIWRLSKYRNDDDCGLECTAFRNEQRTYHASDLIRFAEEHAQSEYPYVPRMFTTINTRKVAPIRVRGQNVWGYTWRKAGWKILKRRTGKNLLRLEKNIIPRGWLMPYDATHATTPCKYIARNPNAGGRPRMEKAVRTPRPRHKSNPPHQPTLLNT